MRSWEGNIKILQVIILFNVSLGGVSDEFKIVEQEGGTD